MGDPEQMRQQKDEPPFDEQHAISLEYPGWELGRQHSHHDLHLLVPCAWNSQQLQHQAFSAIPEIHRPSAPGWDRETSQEKQSSLGGQECGDSCPK